MQQALWIKRMSGIVRFVDEKYWLYFNFKITNASTFSVTVASVQGHVEFDDWKDAKFVALITDMTDDMQLGGPVFKRITHLRTGEVSVRCEVQYDEARLVQDYVQERKTGVFRFNGVKAKIACHEINQELEIDLANVDIGHFARNNDGRIAGEKRRT